MIDKTVQQFNKVGGSYICMIVFVSVLEHLFFAIYSEQEVLLKQT
jgi:hypothetical protein